MQGEATITAKTPVEKDPIKLLLEPTPPSLVSDEPIFISLKRIKPMININKLSKPTITGDCNWNPQPKYKPACLRRIMAIPININEIITPEQNDRAWALIFDGDWLLIETKLSTFREIIGKTQGIRFKIKPPTKANNNACNNERSNEFCVIPSSSEFIMKLSLLFIVITPDKESMGTESLIFFTFSK